MGYRIIIVIISSQLLHNNSFGQLIDGPANCRSSINGKTLFILNDSTYIAAYEMENDWYKIIVSAYISTNVYSNGVLNKGSKLLNLENEIIGTTQAEIRVPIESFQIDGNDYFMVHLEAYTYKSNIRKNTILEREIERILRIQDPSIKTLAMKDAIENFRFYSHEVSGYTVYTTYDEINPNSPEIRMFIYYSGTDLIAIANNNRGLTIHSLKHGKIDRDYNIYYFIPLTASEENTFKEKMDNYFRFRD